MFSVSAECLFKNPFFPLFLNTKSNWCKIYLNLSERSPISRGWIKFSLHQLQHYKWKVSKSVFSFSRILVPILAPIFKFRSRNEQIYPTSKNEPNIEMRVCCEPWILNILSHFCCGLTLSSFVHLKWKLDFGGPVGTRSEIRKSLFRYVFWVSNSSQLYSFQVRNFKFCGVESKTYMKM